MDTYHNNIPHEEESQTPQMEFSPQEPQVEEIVEPRFEEVGEPEVTYIPQEPQMPYSPWENQDEYTPRKKKVSPFEDSPYVSYASYHQDSKPRKPKKKIKFWKPVVAILLAACLVAGTYVITTDMVNAKWESRVGELTEQFDAKMASLEKKLDANGSSVVLVPSTTGESTEGLYTPSQVYAANVNSVVLITNRFTNSQGATAVSGGSGFIVSKDGYIVTNHHVVEGNGAITVITTNGTEYTATVIGSDDTNDVALIKVNALNLRPVTLGSSAQTIVGDQVAAIGNPLGELTSTLTVVYISAKERDITTEGVVINMLQTDAAINSGNSGGPLFNMRGEVIGITTAKYSGNSSSGASIEGVGFAIPIDDVIGILSDLADYGYVTSGYLGVEVADMNAEVANYYGMPVGAYIQKIIPGYAAEKAGLRAKDIIVELGGYDVNNVSGLTRALRHYKPGEETIIVVYRGGQKLTLNIVLDAIPVEEPEATTPETVPGGTSGGNGFSDWWSGFLPPFFGNNG